MVNGSKEIQRCGNYAELWEALGKEPGWEGCSLPKGHEGLCSDEDDSESDIDSLDLEED